MDRKRVGKNNGYDNKSDERGVARRVYICLPEMLIDFPCRTLIRMHELFSILGADHHSIRLCCPLETLSANVKGRKLFEKTNVDEEGVRDKTWIAKKNCCLFELNYAKQKMKMGKFT